MELCDTHAHLTFPDFADQLPVLLQKAEQAHVTRIVTIGIDPEQNQKVIDLAGQTPHIWAAVGFHPHDIEQIEIENLDRLREQAQKKQVIAIGEIGLDYVKGPKDREKQQTMFETQLQIAAWLHLPVIIHNREAHEDTWKILSKYPMLTGVMHCCSGDFEQAQKYLDLGYYLGFNGIVTFPNAKATQQVAQKVPLEKILLETDCPFLAPQPVRGQTNKPEYITMIAEHIAQLRNIEVEKLAHQTTQNAMELFKLI